jgi:hypothetical protein
MVGNPGRAVGQSLVLLGKRQNKEEREDGAAETGEQRRVIQGIEYMIRNPSVLGALIQKS